MYMAIEFRLGSYLVLATVAVSMARLASGTVTPPPRSSVVVVEPGPPPVTPVRPVSVPAAS
ncbi:hypothetical protein D3C71_1486560 [compost metagenome]